MFKHIPRPLVTFAISICAALFYLEPFLQSVTEFYEWRYKARAKELQNELDRQLKQNVRPREPSLEHRELAQQKPIFP